MRDCVKLTAYFGERQRSGGRFLAEAMLDLHEQRGVAVSAVLRGIGGFGSRHRLRSDQSLSLSEDPPVAVVAVDAQATVEAMLDPLRVMSERALMTLERVRLVDAAIASSELDEHLQDRFDDLVQTNLVGTYSCLRAAQRHLLPPDSPRQLVVISSILGRFGVPESQE